MNELENIGLFIFGKARQRGEIPHMGSSYTHQSITHMITAIFYRHIEKNSIVNFTFLKT